MKRFSQRVVSCPTPLPPPPTLTPFSAPKPSRNCSPHAPIARFPHPPSQTAGHTLTPADVQLSRNKDSNKSSKKKDPKDGTASPGSTSQNSPTNTPSSSTSTLNDIRNKPLPPNSAGTNDGGAGATGQSPLSNMTSAPGSGAFAGLGSSPQNSNGAANSQRGGLPPTVIISPSSSVRFAQSPPRRGGVAKLTSRYCVAYPPTRCPRNDASRPCAPKSWAEVPHVRSPRLYTQGCPRRNQDTQETTFISIRHFGASRVGEAAWVP